MSGFEIAMIAGTAMSAISSIQQGQAAQQAGQYNAAIAQQNAAASRQQAEANAAAQQRKARMQIGAMRAGYGASGVGIEGSPLDVIESSATLAELDRQNILYGGEMKSTGYESTAGLELMRGSAAETQGLMSAGSTLLSAYGNYSKGQEAPVEYTNARGTLIRTA